MSTPRVGSSRMSTRGSASSHLASTAFCWVAAAERGHRHGGAPGGLDAEPVDHPGDLFPAPRTWRSAAPERAPHGRQGDVVEHGHACRRGRSASGPRSRRPGRARSRRRGSGTPRCRRRRARRRRRTGPSRCARSRPGRTARRSRRRAVRRRRPRTPRRACDRPLTESRGSPGSSGVPDRSVRACARPSAGSARPPRYGRARSSR